MRYELRFWEESLTPVDIARKGLPYLQAYRAGVAAAVYPTSLTRRNANAIRKLKEAGVEVALWPLMEKEHGYFPGERNAPGYAAFVRFILDWAEKNRALPDIIAIDLEMPVQQITRVVSARNPWLKLLGIYTSARENLDRERYYRAKARLADLNSEIQDRGVRTLAAVVPWVGLELETEHELLQDMTETPASGIGWDIISPMLYVSMLEGMSSGAITRKDANWLVYDSCRKLRDKFGGRTGVSLGLTGGGVLESEPVFGSPAQLLTGIEAALAAGVRDITIYSLEGILSRDDPGEWFEAIRRARASVPERSRKVADGLAAARRIYPRIARLVDWYRRPP